MHPKPCSGGETGIALVPSDDMDEAEELMLKAFPMQQAYTKIKSKKHDDASPEPAASFDQSTKHCAVRESFEEIGLSVSVEQVQYVSQREENMRIPSIANVYLVTIPHKEVAPPTLKVDGIEIREGLWGKLRGFYFQTDEKKPEKFYVALDYYDDEGNKHAIEVPMKYALMIGQAVRQYRNEMIQKRSELEGSSLFSSRENVEARVKSILNCASLNPLKKTLQTILGAPPEDCLQAISLEGLPGENAKEKRDNLSALAVAFQRRSLDKPFTASQLEAIATEGSQIEKNLLRSQDRLFSLARLPFERSVEEGKATLSYY